MVDLTVAQKRKLVKELRGASKLHAKQADQIEKSLKKSKKKSIDALLKALCVDPNLLVVLDDDVEDEFLESEAFKTFRADIAQRNPMDDLPDLNKVFVKFIEDKKLALGNQKTTIQPT